MSSSIKNYTEQGGERTVIGGELAFEEGARVSGFPSTGGICVLDLKGFDLTQAIGKDYDITSIISVDAFMQATSGETFTVISNATFGGLDGVFCVQGLEISKHQMIFGVAYLPRGADISYILSMQMWRDAGGDVDPESIRLRASLNTEMNEALGFSLD